VRREDRSLRPAQRAGPPVLERPAPVAILPTAGLRHEASARRPVWGLCGGVFCAAVSSKTFPPGVKPLIVAFAVVAGTLLMTSVIYVNGAFSAWSAGRVGGKATVSEVSEAIALSLIPFVSFFALGTTVEIVAISVYGDPPPAKRQTAPLWAYPILVLGGALLVWSIALRRQCITEVQGLSSPQARRTFLIRLSVVLSVLVLLWLLSKNLRR
jgi:hypothetical protein